MVIEWTTKFLRRWSTAARISSIPINSDMIQLAHHHGLQPLQTRLRVVKHRDSCPLHDHITSGQKSHVYVRIMPIGSLDSRTCSVDVGCWCSSTHPQIKQRLPSIDTHQVLAHCPFLPRTHPLPVVVAWGTSLQSRQKSSIVIAAVDCHTHRQ